MSQVPPILPRRSFESSTHHSLSVPKYNSSGFFDNDPEVKKYRDPYFKAVSMGLILIIVIIIWGVLPIYWGSMFRAMEHVHNLHGLVVESPFLSLHGIYLTPPPGSGWWRDRRGGYSGVFGSYWAFDKHDLVRGITWWLAQHQFRLWKRRCWGENLDRHSQ